MGESISGHRVQAYSLTFRSSFSLYLSIILSDWTWVARKRTSWTWAHLRWVSRKDKSRDPLKI